MLCSVFLSCLGSAQAKSISFSLKGDNKGLIMRYMQVTVTQTVAKTVILRLIHCRKSIPWEACGMQEAAFPSCLFFFEAFFFEALPDSQDAFHTLHYQWPLHRFLPYLWIYFGSWTCLLFEFWITKIISYLSLCTWHGWQRPIPKKSHECLLNKWMMEWNERGGGSSTACVGLHLGFTEAPKPAAPALTTMCGLWESASVGHTLNHHTSGQRDFEVVVKVK